VETKKARVFLARAVKHCAVCGAYAQLEQKVFSDSLNYDKSGRLRIVHGLPKALSLNNRKHNSIMRKYRSHFGGTAV